MYKVTRGGGKENLHQRRDREDCPQRVHATMPTKNIKHIEERISKFKNKGKDPAVSSRFKVCADVSTVA